LRDRFGNIFKLNFYNDSELQQIVSRSARILGIDIEADAALHVAQRCRKTPRIANRLLKRVRDFAQVQGHAHISGELASNSLDQLAVDSIGLDQADRDFLLAIIDTFNGGPVGINTLSAAIAEDVSTIEEVIEPYLLQSGFIEKTPRGRIATAAAYAHLNKPFNPSS
jgi:Holliday junction DNA helicase RuvB